MRSYLYLVVQLVVCAQPEEHLLPDFNNNLSTCLSSMFVLERYCHVYRQLLNKISVIWLSLVLPSNFIGNDWGGLGTENPLQICIRSCCWPFLNSPSQRKVPYIATKITVSDGHSRFPPSHGYHKRHWWPFGIQPLILILPQTSYVIHV